MAGDKNSDSWDLNDWKLCNKGNSLVFSETSSELQDTSGVNFSINGVSRNQNSSRTFRDSQIRCVNPAIYVEPLNIDDSELSQNECHLKNVDSADLNTGLSNIHINGNPYPSFNTYRCESLISSKPSIISSTSKSKSLSKIERRCKIDDQSVSPIDSDEQPEVQRYSVNGSKIIKISTSLSNCTLSRHDSGTSLSKKQAYDEWIKKKKLDTLRKKKEAEELELKKKSVEERLKQEKEEKEKLERQNFMIWIEKKKAEDAHKRMITEKELELERQIKELEAKTVIAKEMYLKHWYCKKERERKAQKRKEELKIKELEEERQRKLEESSKAFERWREKTKNRPRPATQGLLPHQQAKPAYINPIPWVVDEIPSTVEKDSILNNKATSSLTRSNVKKTVVQK